MMMTRMLMLRVFAISSGTAGGIFSKSRRRRGPMRLQSSRLLASADRSDGSFTLAPPLLQTLAGGALAGGALADAHALLEATDKAGNISRLDLSFILDTTAATRSGRLAHDTGASSYLEPRPVFRDQHENRASVI